MRVPGMIERARTRVADSVERVGGWADERDPRSASGVAIGAWRRYRAVEGPLQSALLSIYVLVAVIPAVLVMEEYLDPHPNSLANSLVRHYRLNASTSALIHNVLAQGRSHELGSALIAIVSALVFGIGFGHVLQLVYGRAWQLDLRTGVADQVGYGAVLAALYGLLLLLLLQLNEFRTSSTLVKALLGIGWVGFLTLFFVVVPWLLMHKQIPTRDLLPGGHRLGGKPLTAAVGAAHAQTRRRTQTVTQTGSVGGHSGTLAQLRVLPSDCRYREALSLSLGTVSLCRR